MTKRGDDEAPRNHPFRVLTLGESATKIGHRRKICVPNPAGCMPTDSAQLYGSTYGGPYAGYYGGSYAGYYNDSYSYYDYMSYDSQYGYFDQHISFFDGAGHYDRETFDSRGSSVDLFTEYVRSSQGGVDTYDVQHTTTLLDGVYESYGYRDTSTYNATYNTASNDYVYFSNQQSYSIFNSYDYATGAAVTSYDSRSFYDAGFYEYNRSFYNGPGGYDEQTYASYHYNA